jgi:hypothetical protein
VSRVLAKVAGEALEIARYLLDTRERVLRWHRIQLRARTTPRLCVGARYARVGPWSAEELLRSTSNV